MKKDLIGYWVRKKDPDHKPRRGWAVKLFRDYVLPKESRSGTWHAIRVSLNGLPDFGSHAETLCGIEYTLAGVGPEFIDDDTEILYKMAFDREVEVEEVGDLARVTSMKITCYHCALIIGWAKAVNGVAVPRIPKNRNKDQMDAYQEMLDGFDS